MKSKTNLKVQDNCFYNESDLYQYISCNALPRITFINCSFEKVDLTNRVLGSCYFDNCIFNYLSLRESLFSGC
jgi:uncharacterized protein YjbI with pentapeptide repeats